LPGWKKWTYCKGLRESSTAMWLDLENMFLKKPNHELLSYLICGMHPFILEEFRKSLHSRFWDYTAFQENAAIIPFSITLFHSLVSRIPENTEFLNVIIKEFHKIKPE